jgi:transcriptional regulator with XRE-family HTH domain
MIRYDVLGRMVKQRRAAEGLSLRDVARQTDISTSTLSRIENGSTADTEQVITLTRWVGITVERLSDPLTESVPQQVKAIILADPKLTPDEREALCSTFSVLYRQMANG